MITWIQKYFQHHFRSIFAVLLVFIIISFIVGINASGGFGHADRQHVDRPFFTYNLGLQQDQARLIGDANLSANLQMGGMRELPMEQIQNYAFQRAGALHVADQWHIPAATKAEIEEHIKTLRMFAGKDGQFDATVYTTFRDNLKTNPRGLNEGDIARVISDDIRMEKVNKLLAGPGYVLPADVKASLARIGTSWTLATATTDYKDFNPALKPSETDLTKYFEEESARYQVPPRVVATYADFPATAFLASVNVSEAEVRAYYDANPSRFPKAPTVKPADDKTPAVANPDADYAAGRAQAETFLKLERAQKLAVKAASDFALSLYENKVRPSELDAFLAKNKVAAKTLAPFTSESGPAELGGSRQLAAEAFKLNADRFYSEAVSVPNGAVVLFWRETQPARNSTLAEVRDRVVADWTEGEKRRRFVELGKTIKSQLEARLKAGDTFAKAAATVSTATGAKLETKEIAAFTLRTPPQGLDYSIYGTLERLEKGQVSDMSAAQDKGVFVYAVDKKAPDFTEANPEYVTARTQLANGYAGAGVSYISDLVEQELKKTEPKTQ